MADPRVAAVLAILLVAPASVSAQAVTGRILEEGTATPVSGALVELVGPDSSRVDRALSGADGRYALELEGPGPFRLRVERLGYRSTLSGPLTVQRVLRGPVDIELPVYAVPLRPLVATAASRCVVNPNRSAETALLWGEARKVLAVTAMILEERLFRMEVVRFQRHLDTARSEVRDEHLRVGEMRRPFRSPPPEELARSGFVRDDGEEVVYYMPDPTVALSDPFLDDHCFHVAEQRGPRGRLVGLAFEPVRARPERPDVAGVLWLDEASAELRYLEYAYVGFEDDQLERIAGGRAEFEEVADGAWIVRRWHIAMPLLEERRRFLGLSSDVVVTGIREEGGEVLRAFSASGQRVTRTGEERISGRVVELAEGRPLAGSVVHLSGTPRVQVADSAGRWSFGDLSPGRYLVSFSHPFLDTLGVEPPARSVRLPGHGDGLVLSPPSPAEALERVCPRLRGDRGWSGGVLRIRVTDPAGEPVAGAGVEIRSTSRSRRGGPEAMTETGPDGSVRICGVEAGRSLRVGVAEGEREVTAEVRVAEHGFALLEVTLPAEG